MGSQVIEDSNKISNNTSLMFGMPIENAVHGWQTRCGCELLDSLNIIEYTLKRGLSFQIHLSSKLSELTSDIDTMKLVDLVWQNSYKNKTALVQKDSCWWKWRYDQCSENYRTFSVGDSYKTEDVYSVAKFCNKSIFSDIDICDIVRKTEELELDILNEFIMRFGFSLRKIRIWAKAGGKANLLLEKYRFSFSRKINFVLFKNIGHKALYQKRLNFALDLGDTDNT